MKSQYIPLFLAFEVLGFPPAHTAYSSPPIPQNFPAHFSGTLKVLKWQSLKTTEVILALYSARIRELRPVRTC